MPIFKRLQLSTIVLVCAGQVEPSGNPDSSPEYQGTAQAGGSLESDLQREVERNMGAGMDIDSFANATPPDADKPDEGEVLIQSRLLAALTTCTA